MANEPVKDPDFFASHSREDIHNAVQYFSRKKGYIFAILFFGFKLNGYPMGDPKVADAKGVYRLRQCLDREMHCAVMKRGNYVLGIGGQLNRSSNPRFNITFDHFYLGKHTRFSKAYHRKSWLGTSTISFSDQNRSPLTETVPSRF
jgi:hypothetical protein